MSEEITVITITRNRPQLLLRAMESVQRQTCDHRVNHLILVDDCSQTKMMLDTRKDIPQNVVWRMIRREPGEYSGPGRSSRLRNLGVQSLTSEWISFLDDDNEWMENHLQELIRSAHLTGCRAVYSYLQMVNRDGTPYLEQRLPWARDPEEGRRKYRELADAGVYTPGSNIVRDRADPLDHSNPVRTVDTGAWLLSRELLLKIPFRDDFDEVDAENLTGEDDKLLSDLVRNGVPIGCSRQPTLIYYLGGYSNEFKAPFDESFRWY